MENNNLENHREMLMKLGKAMYYFYDGNELDDEQINLIKKATDKQKLLAMEMFAYERLEGINYTNYCHNVIKIKRK